MKLLKDIYCYWLLFLNTILGKYSQEKSIYPTVIFLVCKRRGYLERTHIFKGRTCMQNSSRKTPGGHSNPKIYSCKATMWTTLTYLINFILKSIYKQNKRVRQSPSCRTLYWNLLDRIPLDLRGPSFDSSVLCSLSAFSVVLAVSLGVRWSGQQLTGLAVADRVSQWVWETLCAHLLHVDLGSVGPVLQSIAGTKPSGPRINDISFSQALLSPASLQFPSLRLPPTPCCLWVGVFILHSWVECIHFNIKDF